MTHWLGFDSLVKFSLAGGYLVQTCDDPRKGLSLLEQHPEQIDLVITDLQMPCLDGIELAAELLKINPAPPVVLTRGMVMPKSRDRTWGGDKRTTFQASALSDNREQ